MNARKLLNSKLLQQSMLLVKQHASYYNREQYQALVCRLNLQNSIYLYKLPFTIGVTSYGALGHVPPLELGHVKKIWQFLR